MNLTLDQVKYALKGFFKGKYGQELVFEEVSETTIKTRLFTENHYYAIKATTGGYLDCVFSVRKPEVGERHTGGGDLSDGDLTQETFNRIMQDIVANEVVEIIGAFKDC